MSRYTITAYDTNHNQLWITIGSSHIGAEPCRRTNRVSEILIAYNIKTGQIIDPETDRPVIRHYDPTTGQRTQSSRRIAYFRVYDKDAIFEIYITKHGRKAGIRNYETRRLSDTRAAQILGHPPIHTAPQIINTGYNIKLVIGEGDPQGLRFPGVQNADRWGDPVVHLATCHRVTKVDAGWWGYTYENHYTWDHCPLERATIPEVHQHLMAIADETIKKYGADISRW